MIDHARVLVCIGAGGVGKTTIAAALALEAARAGRRTLVVTVDPARRLGDALGLTGPSHDPRPAAANLDAMMLSQRHGWEQLVDRHAPSPAAAARLRRSPFYRALSGAFAGTHEYLAIDQLCAVVASGRWDLVVLDTPPSAHTFELLEASQRIRGLLDRRLLRVLLAPYRRGHLVSELASHTARYLAGHLEEAAGDVALVQAADFFSALSAFFAAFAARARDFEALLVDPRTAVVLVTAPDERGVAVAQAARARLANHWVGLGAIVVNRAHAAPVEPGPLPDHPQRDWLLANFVDHQRLAAAQAACLARLAAVLPDVPLAIVRELDEDVHDLAGLGALADALSAATQGTRAAPAPAHP